MKILTLRHTLAVPLSIPRPEDLEGGQQGPFPSPVKAASQGKSEPEQLWARPLAASLRKAALGWDVSLWLSCSGRDCEFPGHPGNTLYWLPQCPGASGPLFPGATLGREGRASCSHKAQARLSYRLLTRGLWRGEGWDLEAGRPTSIKPLLRDHRQTGPIFSPPLPSSSPGGAKS